MPPNTLFCSLFLAPPHCKGWWSFGGTKKSTFALCSRRVSGKLVKPHVAQWIHKPPFLVYPRVPPPVQTTSTLRNAKRPLWSLGPKATNGIDMGVYTLCLTFRLGARSSSDLPWASFWQCFSFGLVVSCFFALDCLTLSSGWALHCLVSFVGFLFWFGLLQVRWCLRNITSLDSALFKVELLRFLWPPRFT